MDILAPKLKWLGGRCYRVNPTNDDNTADAKAQTECTGPNPSEYDGIDLYGDDDDGTENSDNYEIVQLDGGATLRFQSTFHVPNAFFGVLIGAKGSTKKRIETETKTTLKVPPLGATDGDVVVSGLQRDAVASARRRIELIVLGARHKQQPTHFLCVPIVQPTIKEQFVRFKAAISGGPAVFGLSESKFQDVDKLHLTFGMLALMDNADRQLASRLLLECQQSIVKPILQSYGGAVDFRVTGIDHMEDDPSKVHVLYGKVVGDALQLIADRMVDAFVRHGLMRREHGREHVKLHMTLINTRFARGDRLEGNDGNGDDDKKADEATRENGQRTVRQAIDARQLLRQFDGFDFGKQTVTEIHLSRRFTASCTNGFYDASAILKFT